MKICSISMRVGAALKDMGHEVLSLWPREPLFDLEAALAARSFVPELIIQEENLGQRTILQGLQHFACPKVFWSLDTHLNLFWQAHYFRLFDGVLTPHASILQRELRAPHPPFARLAMFGAQRPWTPFAQRRHGAAFVGRITEHRPLRRWLAEFLKERHGAEVAQELGFAQMLDLYCDARLAPNEALLGEVNFRLLEAASCGCLVLSQDVGPDQDALFAGGREIETYGHVLELDSQLGHYAARPDAAERLGRAAWERVQREHLVQHRCQDILDFAARLTPAAAQGQESEAAHWLALANLQRAGMFTLAWEELAQALGRLAPTPQVLAALITLLVENGQRDAALGLLHRLVAGGPQPGQPGQPGQSDPSDQSGQPGQSNQSDQLDLNLAGSLAALFLDDWDLARLFWCRHTAASAANRALPASPARLCLLWARELVAAGRPGSSGFAYDPAAHLPRAAVECLYLAQRLAPGDLEITRRLDALASTLPGQDFIRLGHLSHLALHAPQDWRLGLQLGLANLRAFRLRVGLEEVAQARDTAAAQDKADSFFRMLAALDPKGFVSAALGGEGTGS